MGRIGVTELLLILGIALLLFGPSKLADMGKGLGEGLKNFKKGLSGDDEEKPPAPAPPAPAPPPPAQAVEPKAPPAEAKDGNPPPAAG
jgi:sec-independent protein translocase protein TatA